MWFRNSFLKPAPRSNMMSGSPATSGANTGLVVGIMVPLMVLVVIINILVLALVGWIMYKKRNQSYRIKYYNNYA